jgi:hypothetical protein
MSRAHGLGAIWCSSSFGLHPEPFGIGLRCKAINSICGCSLRTRVSPSKKDFYEFMLELPLGSPGFPRFLLVLMNQGLISFISKWPYIQAHHSKWWKWPEILLLLKIWYDVEWLLHVKGEAHLLPLAILLMTFSQILNAPLEHELPLKHTCAFNGYTGFMKPDQQILSFFSSAMVVLKASCFINRYHIKCLLNLPRQDVRQICVWN